MEVCKDRYLIPTTILISILNWDLLQHYFKTEESTLISTPTPTTFLEPVADYLNEEGM